MIKDVYKYLHDNYNDREGWAFVHHFMYILTIGLFIASAAVLIIAAFSVVGFLIAESPAWFVPAIVAFIAGILAVLFWSLLAWINRD